MSRRFSTMRRFFAVLWVALWTPLSVGCFDRSPSGSQSQPPGGQSMQTARPVAITSPVRMRPQRHWTMTGAVGSWKTEEIGFEVAGRIEQVLEPNAEIEQRLLGQNSDDVFAQGTVLARLDDERYRIAAAAAKASVEVATRRKETMQVEVEMGIPAQINAAEIERDLAEKEFQRIEGLFRKDAASQSEWDQARTRRETAAASLAAVQAERAAKQAEVRTLEAQIQHAELQLNEANRGLDDTVLYSSFRGQVASVHVVPGSFVAAGQRVLTIQMMDPIKVELELSASMSRLFRYGDSVRLLAASDATEPIEIVGFVYMTDPVADIHTRTFTVTLLARNQRVHYPIDTESIGRDASIGRTSDIWPLDIQSIVGADAPLVVESRAIHHDEQGPYVWKVTNRHLGDNPTDTPRILKVSKVRITPSETVIPFLGNWNFVPIRVNEGQSLDPQRDMVTGAVHADVPHTSANREPRLSEDAADVQPWNGDEVRVERCDWLLRPGDLVQVEIPATTAPDGFYLPSKVIRHQGGRPSVFIVEPIDANQQNPDNSMHWIARQREIRLAETAHDSRGDAMLHRVTWIDQMSLDESIRVVAEGVHFLLDGERVSISSRQELRP